MLEDLDFRTLAILVFVVGYAAIALEQSLQLHKAATGLITGITVWILAAISGRLTHEELVHAGETTAAEIFGIFAFLLAAMTLVETLVHYGFFDVIRVALYKRRLDDKRQYIVIAVLTFFLSAVLDNLTVTIVMTQIALRFFRGKNMLITVAGIVIFANAGGAWSPIGDVTTLMLWLANKFTAAQIVRYAFVPSTVIATVSGYLLYRQLEYTTPDLDEDSASLTFGEKFIITLTLASFGLPLVMNMIGLPPYMGLLIGLAVVWLMTQLIQRISNHKTHLEADIGLFLTKADHPSLLFFVGILLAVSGLNQLGVLEEFSILLLGERQEFARVAGGNAVLGLLSAIVDNVPLTALAMDIITATDPQLWILLAVAVGTGGSALVIGSVAGVVAMGMVPELTFGRYLRIATLPALAGYAAGMLTWLAQYMLLG